MNREDWEFGVGFIIAVLIVVAFSIGYLTGVIK